jgi:ribonuclease PH
MSFERFNHRQADQMRPVEIIRHFTQFAPGSVLVSFGNTKVIVTATVEERVPRHIHILKEEKRGWLTAEYTMLPGASSNRIQRDRFKISGRTAEIQRLIGRVLRTSLDLSVLGSRTITIDADVIQADGGTRVAAITGGYVALMDCLQHLKENGLLETLPSVMPVAAVSVGIVNGVPILDLDYSEDSEAEVDANIVMTHNGQLIEVQMSSEHQSFTRSEMDHLMDLATKGTQELIALQQQVLQEVVCQP